MQGGCTHLWLKSCLTYFYCRATQFAFQRTTPSLTFPTRHGRWWTWASTSRTSPRSTTRSFQSHSTLSLSSGGQTKGWSLTSTKWNTYSKKVSLKKFDVLGHQICSTRGIKLVFSSCKVSSDKIRWYFFRWINVSQKSWDEKCMREYYFSYLTTSISKIIWLATMLELPSELRAQ